MISGISALDNRAARAWFWRACLWFSALQLLIIAYTPLNLAPDEAHYWEWSRHLDWAYYSKGPLVALLVRFGTALFGTSAFAVRFGSWLCSLLFSISFFFFAVELCGAQLALFAFVLLRSMLFFFSLGLVTTTDPAAALFWVLTLWAAYRALFSAEPRAWILVGIFSGLGMLAKYTLLILPASIFLFMLLDAEARKNFRRKELWLGVLILLLSLLPILAWNSEHDWVNFRHNAGHIYKAEKFFLQPKYLLELIGGQLGLMGPISAVLSVLALVFGWKRFRLNDRVAGFLLFSALPLLALCVFVALTKRVYANWPMPVFISAVLLLAYQVRTEKFSAVHERALKLNFVLALIALWPLLGFTYGLPTKILPTKKLVGWEALGKRVADLRGEIRDPKSFLLTDDYGDASEISFYTAGQPFTYVANTDGRRMNQYDIWGGWEALGGHDALIVLEDPAAAEKLRPHFKTLTALPEKQLPILFGKDLQRTFYFFTAENFDGSVSSSANNF